VTDGWTVRDLALLFAAIQAFVVSGGLVAVHVLREWRINHTRKAQIQAEVRAELRRDAERAKAARRVQVGFRRPTDLPPPHY
jgi:hypothetical protein